MDSSPFYILAYVLMDNHYHLILEMKKEPIDRIMHKLNMGYSKYFNRKYSRVGTIFGGTYKCILITDQTQLFKTLQYILYNPVKAKMVDYPDQYRWSSHFEMALKNPSILSKERLLWRLDHNRENAQKKYYALIRMQKCQNDLMESQNSDWEQYAVEIFFKHWSANCDVRKTIRRKSRAKAIVKQRNNFVHEALNCGYSVDEVADFLKYSKRAIRQIRVRMNETNRGGERGNSN